MEISEEPLIEAVDDADQVIQYLAMLKEELERAETREGNGLIVDRLFYRDLLVLMITTVMEVGKSHGLTPPERESLIPGKPETGTV